MKTDIALIFAIVLAALFGAAGLMAHSASQRAIDAEKKLELAQKDARTAWGRLYDMTEAKDSKLDAVEGQLAMKGFELDQCREKLEKK